VSTQVPPPLCTRRPLTVTLKPPRKSASPSMISRPGTVSDGSLGAGCSSSPSTTIASTNGAPTNAFEPSW
jgi:hypothetical protein